MYKRLISLDKKNSFFLFGPRGTGKSTLLKTAFPGSFVIDLLDSRTYLELSKSPWKLAERVQEKSFVVIDEIQKIPLLLDEVHKLIEDKKIAFGMTGSSARKLKQSGVNLLAGRAFDYKLYPFTALELGPDFSLDETLRWGSLPQVLTYTSTQTRENFLYAYVDTYLKEEIILEQVVRQIEPFSRFLEVAAQMNSECLNFANIAKDSALSAVTIKNYFDILIDTLVGFFIPAFHISVRKRQKKSSKFYFFDLGVVRALQNSLGFFPQPGSFDYGKLFESFLVNEFVRLNSYYRSRFSFSHLRVDDRDEIDLVIERPGRSTALIEIKSKETVDERDAASLLRLRTEFKNANLYVLSRDPVSRTIDGVNFVFWQTGLTEIFASP